LIGLVSADDRGGDAEDDDGVDEDDGNSGVDRDVGDDDFDAGSNDVDDDDGVVDEYDDEGIDECDGDCDGNDDDGGCEGNGDADEDEDGDGGVDEDEVRGDEGAADLAGMALVLGGLGFKKDSHEGRSLGCTEGRAATGRSAEVLAEECFGKVSSTAVRKAPKSKFHPFL